MSAEIIQFVPHALRARSFKESTGVICPKATLDDLVMDHADTAPCECAPWNVARRDQGDPA